jgi:PRTRC genetic system protein C
MALTATQLKRAFRYNSVSLPDPGAQFSPEQVRDLYAATYPEITTAAIEGPEEQDDTLTYTFRRAVGTKGAELHAKADVRIVTHAQTSQVEINGIQVPRVTRYNIEHRAGHLPEITIYVAPPRVMQVEGNGAAAVALPDASSEISAAVNRFLGWRLPESFAPDNGITFDRERLGAWPGAWPTGTNLFTAEQARAMFEHCFPNLVR